MNPPVVAIILFDSFSTLSTFVQQQQQTFPQTNCQDYIDCHDFFFFSQVLTEPSKIVLSVTTKPKISESTVHFLLLLRPLIPTLPLSVNT